MGRGIKQRALLLVLIMCTIIFMFPAIVFAEVGYVGTAENDGVNFRTEPSMDGKVQMVILGGTELDVIEQVTNDEGEIWYKVSYQGKEGYINGDYVTDEYNPEDYPTETTTEEETTTKKQEETTTEETTAKETTAAETVPTQTTVPETTARQEALTEAPSMPDGNSGSETENKPEPIFKRLFGDHATLAFLIAFFILLGGLVALDIVLVNWRNRKLNGNGYNKYKYDEYDDYYEDEDYDEKPDGEEIDEEEYEPFDEI